MSRQFFCFALLILFSSCFSYRQPQTNFTSPNSTVDYSNENNWCALPSKYDNADITPKNSGFKENQANAEADVFFIHPTSYKGKSWNADVGNQRTNRLTDNFSIVMQASVFNESCKVYAPRYRQATLYSFFDKNGDGKKALDFAYQDVKNAFEYYLKHYNNGRPVIIAGHSQGTTHAIRLLKDFFDNQRLQKKLVAAYLIGMNVDKNSYQTILPCNNADDIGCFISWATYMRLKKNPGYFVNMDMDEKEFEKLLPTIVCTNPLSWKNDTSAVTNDKNLGGVPFMFNRIDKNITDAQCMNGILWVDPPLKKNGYTVLFKNNFHLMDYNLFWMNIRQNVKDRIRNYLNNKTNW